MSSRIWSRCLQLICIYTNMNEGALKISRFNAILHKTDKISINLIFLLFFSCSDYELYSTHFVGKGTSLLHIRRNYDFKKDMELTKKCGGLNIFLLRSIFLDEIFKANVDFQSMHIIWNCQIKAVYKHIFSIFVLLLLWVK